MHGTYDHEYERERELAIARTMAVGLWAGWIQFVVSAILTIVVVLLFHSYNAPAGVMISATIAVCTLCLIVIINHGVMVLQGDLTNVGFAIEWFEKKNLLATLGAASVEQEMLAPEPAHGARRVVYRRPANPYGRR